MKIAITGVNGFIGSHMADFLIKRGHAVIPIYREVIDLRDYTSVQGIFNGVDQVYHFAAHIGGVGYLDVHSYDSFTDNMTMDLNVLKECERAGVKRVFYSASVCAYPIDTQQNANSIPAFREEQLVPANSNQMYGWEKLMMILLARHAPFDLRVGIFDTIFGEGQGWTGDRVKFPSAITYKVIQSKKTGEPIRIWGDGSQARSFLYIDDAVEKIYEVMSTNEYWGEVNIGGGEVATVKQVADLLCDIAGIKPNYIFELDKPTGPMARGIDNRKFNSHYTYRNRFSARQGFERIYSWMEKQL